MSLIGKGGVSVFVKYSLIFLILILVSFIMVFVNKIQVDYVENELANNLSDLRLENVLLEDGIFNVDIVDKNNSLLKAKFFRFIFFNDEFRDVFEVQNFNISNENEYSFSFELQNLSFQENIDFEFVVIFDAGFFNKKVEGKKSLSGLKNNNNKEKHNFNTSVSEIKHSSSSDGGGSSGGDSSGSGSSGSGSIADDLGENSSGNGEAFVNFGCLNESLFPNPRFNSSVNFMIDNISNYNLSGFFVDNDFIYQKGYYSLDGLDWNEFNFSGDSYCSFDNWLNVSAFFDVSDFNYVSYYTCKGNETLDCFLGDDWELFILNSSKIFYPLSYWSFDNYSSDFIFDDSSNDYNLALVNVGEYLGFKGSSVDLTWGSYLDCGNWNFGNDEMALSLWVKNNLSEDIATVIMKSNETFVNWGLFLDDIGGAYYPSFYLLTEEGSAQVISSISLSEDWTNVIVNYNGEFLSIYVNGVLVDSKKISGLIFENDNEILIGERFGKVLNYSFVGGLDEFFIFNRSLSNAEIISLSSWEKDESLCEGIICNDYNYCTVDYCSEGKCVYEVVENCSNEISYKIPAILTADSFSNKVYIDPSSSFNGDGSISNPRNTFSGVTFQKDTAYLLKAGTVLNENVNGYFEDVYVGSYGEGEKPVIYGSFRVNDNSKNLIVNGLRIQVDGGGPESYRSVLRTPDTSGSYLTFANNEIFGIDSGKGYPFYNMKGGGSNLIFYHNEFAYCRNDGIFGTFFENSTFVSNYFHHQNMAGLNATDSTGDGIQMEAAHASNVYFANNYMDRSHTIWKFALIVNSKLDMSKNFVAEYNTFIAPRQGNGGAAVRWHAGRENKLRRNLFDVSTGLLAVAGNILHQNQSYPYGMRDNHKVGFGPLCYDVSQMTQLEYKNLEFADYTDYNSYLSSNPEIGQYGSDINPNNFWG